MSSSPHPAKLLATFLAAVSCSYLTPAASVPMTASAAESASPPRARVRLTKSGDPLGLGVVQVEVLERAAVSGRRSRVVARGPDGSVRGSLDVHTHGAGNRLRTRVTATLAGTTAVAVIDRSGRLLRDEISGSRVAPVAAWLVDTLPNTASKETCNVHEGSCWCQCETTWPGDHVFCFANKMAAIHNGYDADQGWWYQQGSHKCAG